MDSCCALLLPEWTQIEGLDRNQKSVIWDGVCYPQGAETYFWGEFLEIVQTPVPGHFRSYLPTGYVDESWIALLIRGKGLDLLQAEANGITVDWHGKSFDDLLRLLLRNVRNWVVIFELHCDQIDRLHVLDIDSCLRLLRDNLTFEAETEGFLVIPPE